MWQCEAAIGLEHNGLINISGQAVRYAARPFMVCCDSRRGSAGQFYSNVQKIYHY